MQDIIEFHKTLTDKASKSATEVRQHLGMTVGHVAHQGDVYIVKIKERPACWNVENALSQQVALGATSGSRHCADTGRVFWPDSRENAIAAIDKLVPGYSNKLGTGTGACIGPIVESETGWTLTHPEHAHHSFEAGTYLVLYQLDRRTMREVKD